MNCLVFLFRTLTRGKLLLTIVLSLFMVAIFCSNTFAAPQIQFRYFSSLDTDSGQADSIHYIQKRIQELNQKIATAKEELRQLLEQLKEAKKQLQDLLQNKPKQPDNPSAMPAYNKAFADWQKKVNTMQERVNQIQRSIDAKKSEIAELEKEREFYLRKLP